MKFLYFWMSPFNVFLILHIPSLSLSLYCSVSCCMNVELETKMNYLINLHNFAQLTREELLMNIYRDNVFELEQLPDSYYSEVAKRGSRVFSLLFSNCLCLCLCFYICVLCLCLYVSIPVILSICL